MVLAVQHKEALPLGPKSQDKLLSIQLSSSRGGRQTEEAIGGGLACSRGSRTNLRLLWNNGAFVDARWAEWLTKKLTDSRRSAIDSFKVDGGWMDGSARSGRDVEMIEGGQWLVDARKE